METVHEAGKQPSAPMTCGNIQRMVFFGDSICVGQGVSIHKGWVSRLAARADTLAKCLGLELVVDNCSVNGSTTRQALERMPYDVQSRGVSILIVQFGLNDCNYWQTDNGLPRVSPPGFAANLREIVERAFVFGAQRVILNTNHQTTRDQDIFPNTNTTFESNNIAYNKIIREVVSSFDKRVALNDVERSFRDQVTNNMIRLEDLLLADGLHLSETGHGIYFDCIFPIVEDAIVSLAAAHRRRYFPRKDAERK